MLKRQVHAMVENLIGRSAALLNSSFIAIAMVKNRQIIWANPTMHRIFGYELDELFGQPTLTLFIDQESYQAFAQNAYSSIEKNGYFTGTFPQKRKDGTKGYYEFHISPLESYPDIFVGAIVDRTENYETIQQLEESELRYRAVVEDQTEAISRFLPDGMSNGLENFPQKSVE